MSPPPSKGRSNDPLSRQIDKVEQVVTSKSASDGVKEIDEASLIPVPVESIPMNVALPCTLYIRVAGKFVLFRSQGERLTAKRAVHLQDKGAQTLSIHKAAWEIFLDALEKQKLPEPITPDSASLQLRNLLVAYGQELERVIREPKRPLFDKLEKLCDSLATVIKSDPAVGTKLLRKVDDPALYYTTHAVNCAIYAAVIGFKMGMSLEEMKELTYAALVHDIGKLLISKKILTKTSELTAEEQGILRSHTRQGAEVLQSMGCPPSVVLTALHHHERMDGKGYPSRLSGTEINAYARICTIADAYDTLTSNRPMRPALTPAQALDKMRSLDGKFDVNYMGTAVGAPAPAPRTGG